MVSRVVRWGSGWVFLVVGRDIVGEMDVGGEGEVFGSE